MTNLSINNNDCFKVSLMAQTLKKCRETRVRSLGQEDPLEKGMATYSSIFAWEIPWTEVKLLMIMEKERLHGKSSIRSMHFKE